MIPPRQDKLPWRVLLLFAIVAGILGPWVFDKINVPAEYTCSPPTYRLYGDFCGIPLSGGFVAWMTGAELVRRLFFAAGESSNWDMTINSLLIGLFMLLILLPPFTTLFLCLRPVHRRMAVFHTAVCTLAAAAGLLAAWNSYPRLFYAVWGVWLFTLATTIAAVLEFLFLRRQKPFHSRPIPLL